MILLLFSLLLDCIITVVVIIALGDFVLVVVTITTENVATNIAAVLLFSLLYQCGLPPHQRRTII